MGNDSSKIDFDYILKRYLPDQNEKRFKEQLSEEIIREVNRKLKEDGIDGDSILVGSQSRGTELRNSDLDIFIRFSKAYSKEEMEKIGVNIGFDVLPDGVAKYAEHPYVSGKLQGVKIDIVPCYKVEMNSTIISSVDRTPLHTVYMRKVMDEKMRKESVLLKLFMKRQGIYGSELKTSGFSGYVCELIIREFKTFENFIEHVSSLRGRLIIGSREMTGRFNSPVVIIDPVDEQRNAAAAVNETNLSVLKVASKFYLNNPDQFYFTYDEYVDIEIKKARESYIAILRFERPDIIEDILFPQLDLARKSVINLCTSKGFHYLNSYVTLSSDYMDILIELEEGILAKFEKREGPPAENPNSVSFINKYRDSKMKRRGPYINNERVYFDIYREEVKFTKILRNNLDKLNFGHNINQIKSSMKIIDSWNRIKDEKTYEEFMKFSSPVLPP
ncbi:MAG: CCA tRNA nucleotidyltransferase [Candidatus Thermoplasmatota archaeon]|nr:CCA tRNA nucleotidyltransferase [Candidatus Thermoplasmatota archaeon]MCL5790996.1 CCA tRNA nucleotidyltransferase [Candidatus Thermoplasmatota archaeon]